MSTRLTRFEPVLLGFTYCLSYFLIILLGLGILCINWEDNSITSLTSDGNLILPSFTMLTWAFTGIYRIFLGGTGFLRCTPRRSVEKTFSLLFSSLFFQCQMAFLFLSCLWSGAFFCARYRVSKKNEGRQSWNGTSWCSTEFRPLCSVLHGRRGAVSFCTYFRCRFYCAITFHKTIFSLSLYVSPKHKSGGLFFVKHSVHLIDLHRGIFMSFIAAITRPSLRCGNGAERKNEENEYKAELPNGNQKRFRNVH